MATLLPEMDEETLRSFSRMRYGHEMWIDGVERKDGEITAFGLYGHKLQPDKPMPTDYANVLLYDDNGRAENPDREIVNKPHGWKFTFEDKGADVYTLYIDSNSVWITNNEGWHRGTKRDYSNVNYSGAFNMVAKKIISRTDDPGSVMHATLEIMPSKAKYRVGDTAEFTILYEGKPLANSKIVTYCSAWQDLKPVNTDAEGKIRIPVDDRGSYVVIAKHTDTTKCSEDFDETGFSTTLLVEAE